MRRAALAAVATGLAALLAPDSAAARGCETKRSAKAVLYEDAAVQVHAQPLARRQREIVACSRLTGRATVAGLDSSEPSEDISVGVEDVVAGRYLWTSEYSTYAESADVREHQLLDLRTGRRVRLTGQDENTNADVVAVPGALVAADGAQLLRKAIAGGSTVLDQGRSVVAPAAAATALYWRNGETTRSAPLPAVGEQPDPRLPARPVRRRERCLPRGSTVLLRDGGLVVSRGRGGRINGCRIRTGRRYDLADSVVGEARRALVRGPAEGFEALDGRRLLYRLPVTLEDGAPAIAIAVLDLASGEIDNGGGRNLRGVASLRRTVAFLDGEVLSVLEGAGPREVARGAVSEPALGETQVDLYHQYLYWTDGGTAKSLDLAG